MQVNQWYSRGIDKDCHLNKRSEAVIFVVFNRLNLE